MKALVKKIKQYSTRKILVGIQSEAYFSWWQYPLEHRPLDGAYPNLKNSLCLTARNAHIELVFTRLYIQRMNIFQETRKMLDPEKGELYLKCRMWPFFTLCRTLMFSGMYLNCWVRMLGLYWMLSELFNSGKSCCGKVFDDMKLPETTFYIFLN